MIVLGETYFWKYLKDCNSIVINQYAEQLASVLLEAHKVPFNSKALDDAAREKVGRWSRGYFNAPGELSLRFPRIDLVFEDGPDRENRWIAEIFFTRIPHVRGVYSSRSTKHALPGPVSQDLSARLVRSQVADVFRPQEGTIILGNACGLYLHHKILRLKSLRQLAEDSKLTPQGSDFRPLLETLPGLLAAGQAGPALVELAARAAAVRDFLKSCDEQLVRVLNTAGLEALLQPTGVTVEQWLKAGR